MSRSISVGVVGCGYWGPNLVRNFNGLENSDVVAICDTNTQRLAHVQRLYPASQYFTDFDRMLRDVPLDAVVIATPINSHFALAKSSLAAGKHTLIEKPMASSPAECEELIELAERNGLCLMVGHTFLFSGPIRKIREIIDSGEIGDVQYINCQRLNLGLFHNDTNVVWDLAPHDLSIILHILGELPHTVNCQGNAHITPGIEDVTNLSLSFPSRRFATVQNSWLEPRKVRQMTFVGTRKMIVYDDLQPLEKIRIHDVRVNVPPHYDNFSDFPFSYHYGDCHIPRIEQEEPLKTMCLHFIDAIREGAEPISSGRNGLEVVRILEACTVSLKSHGAPVKLATLAN